MLRVREVHDRDAALIPGLHFDVAARNRDERAVVRDTVLAVALRRRQLVIAREVQLVILQVEDRIGAPLVRIVGAAARASPPPHSSVNTTFFPSFENEAECQYE